MRDSLREELGQIMNLESSLSSLLRSLYLHGVEHCAVACGTECSIISKDQVISILERGHADKKVRDALGMLTSSPGGPLPENTVIEPMTQVLLVTDSKAEVVSVDSLPEIASSTPSLDAHIQTEERFPSWWNIPLPLVTYIEREPVSNDAARELLAGIDLPPLPRRKKKFHEFILELPAVKKGRKKNKHKRQILFVELSPSVFRIEDVTEELANVEEMAWWASVGQAFVSSVKGKGKGVRHIRSPDHSVEEIGETLACIWEGQLLGYVCIDEAPTD